MKKILSLTLITLLILSMNVQSFASDKGTASSPIITSRNYDHIIDTSEVMNFLGKIHDNEKREILESYFFMPVSVTESDSKTNNEDIAKMKVPQEAKDLANLPLDNLKTEYSKMIEKKVNEIASKNNVLATPDLKEYLQENKPNLLKLINDKVSDFNNQEPLELRTSNPNTDYGVSSIASTVSMTYYKELKYNSMYGTILWASCNVDWTYDSSTKKILSLYPTTTFWHTGPSPIVHIVSPEWHKNEQKITHPTSGDRGFVQKGRMIMMQDLQGSLYNISMFKFNLVFSPSATNSNKTLLDDTGTPSTQVVDPTNWGGGY